MLAAPAAQRIWRQCSRGTTLRHLSKAAKKGRQPEPANAAASQPSVQTIPVNYLKDGQDPVVMANEHYPEWLRCLTLKNMTELNTKGYDNLTLEELRRYWQLASRRKIKESNADTHL
eukprot:TRINITY_DN740_c0_g1_i4.p2 TRINITY_DN740_c0_g1~~TRINITY_DN740_c0_g1_i4.p2  ORF type:complete len:117 (+),score=18.33 TRINITY_DN740_c0_g1_i4:59-409(+)